MLVSMAVLINQPTTLRENRIRWTGRRFVNRVCFVEN
jgi:hypothetical protein